jgi:hypothetical protein
LSEQTFSVQNEQPVWPRFVLRKSGDQNPDKILGENKFKCDRTLRVGKSADSIENCEDYVKVPKLDVLHRVKMDFENWEPAPFKKAPDDLAVDMGGLMFDIER